MKDLAHHTSLKLLHSKSGTFGSDEDNEFPASVPLQNYTEDSKMSYGVGTAAFILSFFLTVKK